MLKTYLAVMCGGAIGTGLRMALSGWLAERYGEIFPVGTLVVNITGCFFIGAFAELTGPNGLFFTSALARQVVMLGVFGGYTTFSSFGLQTLNLAQDGEWLRAGANALLSLVLCLLAVWIGHVIAAAFNQRSL
jgi:CrcB protein